MKQLDKNEASRSYASQCRHVSVPSWHLLSDRAEVACKWEMAGGQIRCGRVFIFLTNRINKCRNKKAIHKEYVVSVGIHCKATFDLDIRL